ncbi:MAG: NAD(P)/FAD-dependent oxidoreductase [Candidatus Bathyarchaeota archaeon]|nr:NAD(P)/FAD-dependent oxidoreductase [Candidatus Bathyarchaeota archaeon]MDW8040054.1 NAD(P)/FAD-dependent oxidoreductase [Nitrososphaerota archaeon]
MEKFSDVVVVGGGPSGSFCALNMAKKAVSVIVFEEHDEIGTPCHCAGHLSITGLKNLGLYPLPKRVIENVFYGVKIHSPNGSEFTIRFSLPTTCVVNRALFDKHLSDLAKKSGIRYFLGSKVDSLTLDGSLAKLLISKTSGETFKFSSRIVVDAEGTSYKILRQAGLTPPEKGFVYCVNAEVENVNNLEPDKVEVFLGNTYAPGFYAWLIPKEKDVAKIGLGAKAGNPKTLLRKLMHKHPAASKKLKKAKILQETFHPIPLGGPIKRAYAHGFLVVGDAAAQVKPTTGGGIILGLNCARIAADVAVEAINTKDFSPKFLRVYQKRLMKLLGFDIKVMREIRKILDRIHDKELDNFISLCRRNFGEEDFQDLIETDFQGRALLRAVKKPRITAAIAYFLLLSLKSILK